MSDSDPDRKPDTLVDTDEAYCAACNQSFTIDAEYCPNDGAKLIKLKARPDTLIGRVFDGRFEVRGPLGHGGMGTVYRGWQLSVDREIAIKVIHPKLSDDRAIAKRFLREARLASRLSQGNIVSVYEFGQTEDGILYLAMELLRGRPLSKDLEAMRPLPMRRIKAIGMQICDALEAAHGQGIIHRDLKPGNIVILDDAAGRDLVKILDFGLAKSLVQENTSLVTRTDAILGTPLYMPPEQILGKPSDQTADLYSLGCILYQLATGRPPYVGENVNIVLASHVRDPIPDVGANVPADLRDLIQTLMRKEPAERYQTAREVRGALEALADDPESILTTRPRAIPTRGAPSGAVESVIAPSAERVAFAATARTPVPMSPTLVETPRRRRWLLPVVALGLLGAAGLATFAALRQDEPIRASSPSTDPASADAAPPAPDAAQVLAPDAVLASPPDATRATPADAPPTRLPIRRDPPRRDPPRRDPPPEPPRQRPPDPPTEPPRDAGVARPDAADIEIIVRPKKS